MKSRSIPYFKVSTSNCMTYNLLWRCQNPFHSRSLLCPTAVNSIFSSISSIRKKRSIGRRFSPFHQYPYAFLNGLKSRIVPKIVPMSGDDEWFWLTYGDIRHGSYDGEKASNVVILHHSLSCLIIWNHWLYQGSTPPASTNQRSTSFIKLAEKGEPRISNCVINRLAFCHFWPPWNLSFHDLVHSINFYECHNVVFCKRRVRNFDFMCRPKPTV